MAIRQLLLRNDQDIGKANPGQNATDRLIAGAVQGRVDDLEVTVALDGLEVDRQLFQHGGIDCVEIFAKILPQAGCTGIFFTEAIQKRREILD